MDNATRISLEASCLYEICACIYSHEICAISSTIGTQIPLLAASGLTRECSPAGTTSTTPTSSSAGVNPRTSLRWPNETSRRLLVAVKTPRLWKVPPWSRIRTTCSKTPIKGSENDHSPLVAFALGIQLSRLGGGMSAQQPHERGATTWGLWTLRCAVLVKYQACANIEKAWPQALEISATVLLSHCVFRIALLVTQLTSSHWRIREYESLWFLKNGHCVRSPVLE